jgi:integrase/recombinase XerD
MAPKSLGGTLACVIKASEYPQKSPCRFTPHKQRHTFLKKAADKHGLHFAHEASGNVSIKEIFRYAKPSQDEIDEAVEELFIET